MALSDADRRELERIATSGPTQFGDRGVVEALRRFGGADLSDRALVDRAAAKVNEKAGA